MQTEGRFNKDYFGDRPCFPGAMFFFYLVSTKPDYFLRLRNNSRFSFLRFKANLKHVNSE